MRRCSLFLISLLLTSLLFACQPRPICQDPLGCWDFSPADEIWLSFDQPLVEPERSIGIEIRRGLEIYVAAHPEYKKHLVRIFEQSVTCIPGAVENGINELAGAPDQVALIGPACPQDPGRVLHLVNDAGMAVISPLPVDVSGVFPYWLSLVPIEENIAKSTSALLAQSVPQKEIGWAVENTPAQRQLLQVLCSQLSALGKVCLEPVLIDSGVNNLKPYLSLPVLADADTWVFLYSSQAFSSLNDLSSLLEGKMIILVDPASSGPDISSLPLNNFDFIGQAEKEIPNQFTLQYQKRYNGQNTLISFNSYQAAGMILQAIDQTAQPAKNGGFLLPRQAFLQALFGQQVDQPAICLTPIQESQFLKAAQTCQ